MTKEKTQKYVKKDPISHILDRPDMYVGSTRSRQVEEFIFDSSQNKIVKKSIDISPGIVRIFVEPLSNAVDNVARSKIGKNKVNEIKINISEDGETTFWNDGEVVPIEIHEEEKCYNHTLIFGQLLTSSNYDDEEDREDISGKNGLGIKAVSVFSKQFRVEGVDTTNKKKFVQTWYENMKSHDEPEVSKCTEKKGYTEIKYTPDFKRFGIDNYTPDIISFYKKLATDSAMITGVDIYFNDELIHVKNLLDYAKLYTVDFPIEKPNLPKRSTSSKSEEDVEVDLDQPQSEYNYLNIKTKDCNVLLTTANEFQAISFANGIFTPLGGTHVEAWTEALFRPILEKFNKKGKPQLNIRDIKQFFRIFVVATVKKPDFDGQSKTKLEGPLVEAEVKKTHIATICKWSVMEHIEDIIRTKELGALKKIERKKKYIKIDSLDSANNEGGPRSHECTLILVEGLSAKTYATHGISSGAFGKSGRDWFGIYALRGKVLNCRNATPASIAKNSVVSDIIKALGVKTDVDYRDDKEYRKLRYGRILSVTDADVDGIHISGLLQNMFHALFPTLLQRDLPFFTSMQTPIVRVFLTAKNSILFYDENEYRRYVSKFSKENPNKTLDKKYYKGLGTNNEEDIDESFGKKLVQFKVDDKTFDSMNKAFHKKYADMRKDWLENYDPSRTVLKWKGNSEEMKDISLSDFVDTELIKFSHDDCKRSIPSLIDGLKEGHRKVLYVTLLRKLKYTGKTLKVAQLAGSVAEKSGYHHGEQNLLSTITHMANAYVGSNNIPLLYRDGQFGSRLEGGKDAANGRYIFTKLEALTRTIFREEDDVLLTYIEDDGDTVEPYFYVPIIPMILVNGNICGIGTGWSSNIPCYNPIDLVASIKVWLENDGKALSTQDGTTVSLLPEITPWYRGYNGTIDKTEDSSKYISLGKIEKVANKTVITELPVGVWTNKYKEQLEEWMEGGQIKKFENHSTPKTVNFTITESEDGFSCNLENLKLSNIIRTTNMCLFTENGKLKKFNNTDEIIDNFCKVRFEYYIKRKKYLLDNLQNDIKYMGNKKRFLTEVRDGDILLFNEEEGKRVYRKTSELYSELEERGYDKKEKEKVEQDEEQEEKTNLSKSGYDYLLSMQIRSITQEKIDKLQKDIENKIKELDILKKTSEKEIWLNELDEFMDAYEKWLDIISKEKVKIKKDKK